MDEQHPDVFLLRPAVEPTVPRAARALLTGQGALPSRLDPLPREPERRLATVEGAATGLTAGIVVAVTGAVPWAIGVLIFQGAVSWQSATGRYTLLLMEMIVAVTTVVFGTQVARFGQLRAQHAAAAARSRYRGRYLTGDDLDAPGRVLLRRAQDAVDAVTNAAVSAAGLLDEATALAAQEWEVAVSLRDQARLRARRAEITQGTGLAVARLTARPPASCSGQLVDAARVAEQSVTDRVAALEKFAAEVRQADAAHRDWHVRARLAEAHRAAPGPARQDGGRLARHRRAHPRCPRAPAPSAAPSARAAFTRAAPSTRAPPPATKAVKRRARVRPDGAFPEGVPSTPPGNAPRSWNPAVDAEHRCQRSIRRRRVTRRAAA